MESYYHILFDKLSEDQLERKKLGDLFTIKGGATPSTKYPEYFCQEGGIPWVGIKDLTSRKGKFIDRGETNITQEGYNSCSTYIIPEDSILFSCRGTIGVIAINDQQICFTRGLFGLFGDKFLKNYFWFLLKDNLEKIKGLGRGTVMSGMGQEDLRNFQINLPPRLLMVTFEQICEPFFQIQKTNEKEIRELLKLQKYFIELTN
ncbi:hypothetical protein DNK47_03190 [Mycoplasma wenyonii]|uniref:Type I restriction modification DNA specificity domain-containing protein n=1 Tax=Mycoplasma wenyonii TaxID=65123 RepID=A0A328PJ03_9MOLU|nr:restriction endonuclease subunit S [Mycoplasma wenyonii]RAO94782.1 hypothetical protein DNK47_03190 [Mycoplasma wenyonii]